MPMKKMALSFAWVALIHVLTSLVGFGSIYLALASFAGGSDSAFMALCMLLLWFVGGLFAPKTLCGVGCMAALWAALAYSAELLLDNYWLTIPQFVAGVGLAYLWPGDQHSAWFFDVLEPAMATAAHILLPLALLLGVWVRRLYEKKNIQ